MDLYRIILVDDEEEVRKSIIRKIDWQAVGFTVVGDAENGEDALEKIEALEPDVVLTDIRMPYMDGLTLAEKIRQRYPSMKIVIFSGYDDFDYAKRAIKLNVTEYILKPVNVEELSEILRRVKQNLDEEISQRRDAAILRESYQRSLPILREVFLNDLVRGSANTAMIDKCGRDCHIRSCTITYYSVLSRITGNNIRRSLIHVVKQGNIGIISLGLLTIGAISIKVHVHRQVFQQADCSIGTDVQSV